ncbi:hypothetical protein EYF80_036746 [Liparis tanakae]|uniref:Uncharacterized protein n=1 Tax=Liparis tanakae TaxID=230148 RepID=A0A4Z2GJJ1_9TELE|nr:hypothetical protein EYF80_036746 [Liparis tanakae]
MRTEVLLLLSSGLLYPASPLATPPTSGKPSVNVVVLGTRTRSSGNAGAVRLSLTSGGRPRTDSRLPIVVNPVSDEMKRGAAAPTPGGGPQTLRAALQLTWTGVRPDDHTLKPEAG